MAQDSFDENAKWLSKIIDQSLPIDPEQHDEAIEFLDAMVSDYNDMMTALKSKISELQDEINENLAYVNMDDDCFTHHNYGTGEFMYYNRDLNLQFEQKLEQFFEDFKNNKV